MSDFASMACRDDHTTFGYSNGDPTLDVRPEDSVSQNGSRSSRSSRASSTRSLLRLQEEQKRAELLTRIEAEKEKRNIGETRRKLELQTKQITEELQSTLRALEEKEDELKLTTELKVSEARIEAIDKFEETVDRKCASETHVKFKDYHTPKENETNHRMPHTSTPNDAGSMPMSMMNIPQFHQTGITPSQQGIRLSSIRPIDTNVEGQTSENHAMHLSDSSELLASALNGLAERLVSRDNLPKMMPEKFDGDLLRYTYWEQSFDSMIDQNCSSISHKMYYLSKCTEGKARTAIEGYLVLNTEDAYKRARALLRKRYGDKYLLARECKKKIRDWPLIKYGDGMALREFSDFLLHCRTTMHTTSHLMSLDAEEENAIMLAKLPKYIVDRWLRVVDRWLNTEEESEQCYPNFGTFCDFLEAESRVACISTSLKPHSATVEKNEVSTISRQRRKVGSFATNCNSEEKESTSNCEALTVLATGGSVQKSDDICFLCNKSHSLDSCGGFKKMTVSERKHFMRKKGLCFRCITGRHLARTCNKKIECLTCGGFHPTLLHDSEYNTRHKDVMTHCTNQTQMEPATGSQFNSMILPVILHHNDSPQQKIKVYALLDEQSNSTFIAQQTVDKLGTKGRHVKIKLATMLGEKITDSEIFHGLTVCGFGDATPILLPGTYVRDSIPADKGLIPHPDTAWNWPHLNSIATSMFPPDKDMEIGLLIGLNCPHAIKPRELIPGKDEEPWAVRTTLGWGIAGIVDTCHTQLVSVTNDKPCHLAFRTHLTEISPVTIHQMFDLDFNERKTEQKISVEDNRFLDALSNGIHRRPDGHFETPLPFKDEVKLPNNRQMAMKRLSSLKARLLRDGKYREDYGRFMSDMIDKEYAEPVPPDELQNNEGRTWYIPHHGVYHPKKKEKIRVVFDCSAEYRGEVLNRHLLQGPDLINNLTGVLCRFRQEPIAVSCDIEAMFHQVGVNQEDRNFLRFLWWPDGNMNTEPSEFRMTVHLFGATSSPGCANYALKATASNHRKEYGNEAADFVKNNFYVDDGLQSVGTIEEATKLITNSRALCRKGGFNLHKFMCNDKSVLASVSPELRAKDVQNIDLTLDSLPVERTLGVHWCVQSDTFNFRIEVKDKPLTRRGILSTVSSVFDPLGLVSPYVLIGKQILQELVRDGSDWDDPIPEELRMRWERWRGELSSLTDIRVPRCYRDDKPVKIELHCFSDASQMAYGQCSYLRLIDGHGNISTSLVMAKSRVTPSKIVTIPRLELTAAVVSVKVGNFLQRELDYKDMDMYYWTDSKVVLGYIANESRRFHIFVANRVQQIRNMTEVNTWNHIDTANNPADIASRGATAAGLSTSTTWWKGPAFLQSSAPLPLACQCEPVGTNDPEVKRSVVHATQTKGTFSDLLNRIEYFSDWHRAKRALAVCIRYKDILKARVAEKKNGKGNESVLCSKEDLYLRITSHYTPVNVSEMQIATRIIIEAAQSRAFPTELDILRRLGKYAKERKGCKERNLLLKQKSCLYRLDPYIGKDGLLRVGGRIRRANVPLSLAHPVVLPKTGHVTHLIVEHYHRKVCHSGRGITLNEIRASGYWVIKARTTITLVIWNCIVCKRLYSKPMVQKMADLPEDRVQPEDPFSYSAVDYFGPFYIKEGRSERKRWGVLFTCMASRAIHIETANSLTTGSFINAYRRFTGRRGTVRQLRSDCGTNFVGAKSEFEAALKEMDNGQIAKELLKDNCDFVCFKMNPPHASHMGGVWERMIRSVRRVLSALMDTHGERLDDEQLRTFMVEAEAVVNSRPIAYPDTSVPDSGEPLSPCQLLTLKSKVVLPPPGVFMKEDLYCRKRWRMVQFLANQFWSRWKSEYLMALQEKQKWVNERPNIKPNDIVLMKDDCTPRCQWPLARVVEVYPSEDGLVRGVKVIKGNATYDRPIHKLVLIISPGIPDEEPMDN